MHNISGKKQVALDALAGKASHSIPVMLFTWGFDYNWQILGIPPWEAALGSREHRIGAPIAAFERHRPDVLLYDGAGWGPNEATLLDDTPTSWIVRNNNNGEEYEFIKESYTVVHKATGRKDCDPVDGLDSKEDVDRIWNSPPKGHSQNYLSGLSETIARVGDGALVMPTCSPAYIQACYALGFEKAMAAMSENPEFFLYLADKIAEGDDLIMRQFADAGAEAVFIADGWASCDIISPKMFREFALPYQRKTVEAAKKVGLRAVLWNEGDVIPILEDEAALPMDAFAIEQSRKGIDLTVRRVREVLGPERCLFGNLDSELLLQRNDEAEIREAVFDQIRQSGQGAPFIMSCGSPLPSNTPPEAVDAMIRATREFAW